MLSFEIKNKIKITASSSDSKLETRAFPSGNPFSLWVALEIGLRCLRQGPGRPAGSLRHLLPSPRSLPPAWLCEGSVTLNSGRLGSGGSLGTAGKAQAAAPAQFSLTASKALPAWLVAQPRLREGERGGDGRARRPWGGEAGIQPETSRGQHRAIIASSAPQAWGRQTAQSKVPYLGQGRVRPASPWTG